MDVLFEYGMNGDILLHHGERFHNLGYDYVSRLPLMLWLHHRQIGSSALFSSLSLPPEVPPYSSDREFDEVIDTTQRIAQRLPLPLEAFNIETSVHRLSEFSNGTHSCSYQFQLTDQNTLILEGRNRSSYDTVETILSLPPQDSTHMAQQYFDFVFTEPRLCDFRGYLGHLVRSFG